MGQSAPCPPLDSLVRKYAICPVKVSLILSYYFDIFVFRYLKSLMPEFNKSGNILIGKLRSLADGETVVNMMDEMHKVALDVIAKVVPLLRYIFGQTLMPIFIIIYYSSKLHQLFLHTLCYFKSRLARWFAKGYLNEHDLFLEIINGKAHRFCYMQIN